MKIVKRIYIVTNLILIMATCGAYLAPFTSPADSTVIPSLGLVFPGLVLGNLLYFLIGLIWQSKLAMVNLLVLFLGLPYVQNTFNFSLPKAETNQGQILHIATYNTQFSKPLLLPDGNTNKKMLHEFDGFLKNSNHLDILGVQECGWRTQERIKQSMDFPYHYLINDMYTGIYSKHPIVNKGIVDLEQKIKRINRCLWADIVIGKDTIRFYTAHLAPNRHDGKIPVVLDQNQQEHVDYFKMFGIFQHYPPFALKRSEEAALIRAHQAKSPYPCIISGDFNDPPQTFMYATISKDLKDTFLEDGTGFGGTHGGPVPGLRIDYILVDHQFKVLEHQVLEEPYSDHYMVEAALQF